ncbi:unnamed protein product [Oppiella nova]|uniref:Uncharacterized protein n=1 Tax=Oppiella nova TaxID=334625 RepID=A0A7R9M5I7_9ACAR|nr:unnamed protein product [Oppiella nova]CAG2171156.1 unnamed protein product [Oppiella nova]
MCKLTMFAIVALVFVVINQICAETRQVETDVYGLRRPLVNHSYNIGDFLGVSCAAKLVNTETDPEQNDEMLSMTLFKDGQPYHKLIGPGISGRIEDYPTKGIQDISPMGWSSFSHNVGLNEHSGYANNETKGSYTCQVIYKDYQNYTITITSDQYELKLK